MPGTTITRSREKTGRLLDLRRDFHPVSASLGMRWAGPAVRWRPLGLPDGRRNRTSLRFVPSRHSRPVAARG